MARGADEPRRRAKPAEAFFAVSMTAPEPGHRPAA